MHFMLYKLGNSCLQITEQQFIKRAGEKIKIRRFQHSTTAEEKAQGGERHASDKTKLFGFILKWHQYQCHPPHGPPLQVSWSPF